MHSLTRRPDPETAQLIDAVAAELDHVAPHSRSVPTSEVTAAPSYRTATPPLLPQMTAAFTSRPRRPPPHQRREL